MSVKKLFGLESFSITDEEIMRRLEDAYRKHLHEVEFSSPNRRVKVKIKDVNKAGIMRGYWDYYGNAK